MFIDLLKEAEEELGGQLNVEVGSRGLDFLETGECLHKRYYCTIRTEK